MSPESKGNATIAGAASAGTSGAATVLLLWIAGLAKLTVPPEVVASVMVLMGTAMHWAAIKWGLSDVPGGMSSSVTVAPDGTKTTETKPAMGPGSVIVPAPNETNAALAAMTKGM